VIAVIAVIARDRRDRNADCKTNFTATGATTGKNSARSLRPTRKLMTALAR